MAASRITFTVKGISFDMVLVEGGTFLMGNDHWSEEKPVHTESVDTFYLGTTVVTQALWEAVMGCIPTIPDEYFIGSDMPVIRVSWYDCMNFIERLNSITGRKFRLPTEAEWEYAAGGGLHSHGYIYSGSDDIDSVAWHFGNTSGDWLQRVALKHPNELGIYDMSGNVMEWTSDIWSPNYSSPRNGGRSGMERVVRGGGFSSGIPFCRITTRTSYPPDISLCTNGLRLALTPES